jgi:anti-sigma B factor antagonist
MYKYEESHSLISETMEIIQKAVDETLVVTVSGRIDTNTSRDLEDVLNALIETENPKIVVNLDGVEYISSSGLRVLLATLKRLRKENGALHLACLQPFVVEVFEITGFTKLFPIYPDEDEAIRSIH